MESISYISTGDLHVLFLLFFWTTLSIIQGLLLALFWGITPIGVWEIIYMGFWVSNLQICCKEFYLLHDLSGACMSSLRKFRLVSCKGEKLGAWEREVVIGVVL